MPEQTDYNESLLVADLRKGSVHAFEQIFKKHWAPLYQIAKSKLRSHEEAEEVIQTIFSALWEKRETLLITNLTFYLSSALRNRILNLIRDKIPQEKYWHHY
ncbi:MAG TPA: sigma factor, partial [Chryseosolibacter sp.]|nr:sigma factor [Chryseosolibacter sp.]